MKTVAVLGRGILAVLIADWFRQSRKYDLIGVVAPLPEREWETSFRSWAKGYGIQCFSQHEVVPPVDLIVSAQYPKLLKQAFLDRQGWCINLHFSALPKYRGMRPINWALKNNETMHGVTLHEIDAGIDTGPIISQLRFPIDPRTQEVEDVYRECCKQGYLLFLNTIPFLWDIVPRSQEAAAASASYYGTKDIKLLGDRQGWRRDEQ